MLSGNELRLDEFAEYLLKTSLVPEKNSRFYVGWVRRFFQESKNWPADSWEVLLQRYSDLLRDDPAVEDWQVEQAERAVRVYFHNFRHDDESVHTKSALVSVAEDGAFDPMELIGAVREKLRVMHYSYRTEQTYLDWIKRFLDYVQKDNPRSDGRVLVSPASIRDYLAWLALRRKVAASTQNQAFSAILFMARDILNMDPGELKAGVRAKRGRKLPVVLSPDETGRLLEHLKGTELLMVQLLYGGGLRLMELCRLRVKDVDFDNELIFVRGGKGDKDRSTLLPASAIPALKGHIKKLKKLHDQDVEAGCAEVFMPDALARKYPSAAVEFGWQWLFPSKNLSIDPRAGKVRRHHVSSSNVQKIVRNAVKKAEIHKPVSVHTLRHTFATHLLLNGVDIREIQEYLGHANVETTMIYTHVVKTMRNRASSPLDVLNIG